MTANVDATAIAAIERALLKRNNGVAANKAATLGGLAGALARVEVAVRQRQTDTNDFHQQCQLLDAALPGLSTLLSRAVSGGKHALALQQLVGAAPAPFEPQAANYLQGLLLQLLVADNCSQESLAMAIGPDDAIDFSRGLRWSYSAVKALLAANEAERALAAADRLLNAFPDARAPILHLRALVLRQLGRREDAARDLLQCIEHEPYFAPPITALHFIAWSGIAVAESLRVIEPIVATRPCNIKLKSLLADLYSITGRVELAMPLYRQYMQEKMKGERRPLAKMAWPDKNIEKPDFIIIGAPKCGTTSAYSYMTSHPKILPAPIKELEFFLDRGRYELGVDWYLSQFPAISGSNGYICGEASPGYFYSDLARERMAKHFPGTRLILFLRSPAARAISNYYQEVKMGHKLAPLETFFQGQLAKLRERGDSFDPRKAGVVASGIYHYYVDQWLASFGREALLIIKAEDFFTDPAPVMQRIFTHVGVTPMERKHYPVANKGLYPQAPEALVQELEAFYAPHNQRLYERVGQDFGW